MKGVVKFLKDNALLIGGVILLVVFFISSVFGIKLFKRIRNTSSSDNKNIDRVIKVLDEALGSMLTVNSDHEYIFGELMSLSRDDIYKLHKDFGTRMYISYLGTYARYDIPLIDGDEYNLSQIFRSEFDKVQLSRLKTIYESKAIRDLL